MRSVSTMTAGIGESNRASRVDLPVALTAATNRYGNRTGYAVARTRKPAEGGC